MCGSRDEQLGAVAGLGRRGRNRAAAGNALVRRKRAAALDETSQQIECLLRVRLDQLELRKSVLEGLDVVAVLHLVEAVSRRLPVAMISGLLLLGKSGSD